MARLQLFADFDFGAITTDPAACLLSGDVIDSAHPAIQAHAAQLTKGCETPFAKAQAVFDWVRDEVPYNFTPSLRRREDWRASVGLLRGDGFCQQKAVLLAALLRAVGIPAGLGFEHVRDHMLLDTRFEAHLPSGLIVFHGCTMLHLDGTWRIADATLDRRLCERRGYRLVTLNPTADSELPATDLQGGPHFDFLARLGPYANLPQSVSDLFLDLVATWSDMQRLVERTGATM